MAPLSSAHNGTVKDVASAARSHVDGARPRDLQEVSDSELLFASAAHLPRRGGRRGLGSM